MSNLYISAREPLYSEVWWCYSHLGPINSLLLPLYTPETNRLELFLMTKSHTGTWRVESKLIRTGTWGTKKEKLQTNVGLEDGGSRDLKKYKVMCVCTYICIIYTHKHMYTLLRQILFSEDGCKNYLLISHALLFSFIYLFFFILFFFKYQGSLFSGLILNLWLQIMSLFWE